MTRLRSKRALRSRVMLFREGDGRVQMAPRTGHNSNHPYVPNGGASGADSTTRAIGCVAGSDRAMCSRGPARLDRSLCALRSTRGRPKSSLPRKSIRMFLNTCLAYRNPFNSTTSRDVLPRERARVVPSGDQSIDRMSMRSSKSVIFTSPLVSSPALMEWLHTLS
jgi:hypothetical protein